MMRTCVRSEHLRAPSRRRQPVASPRRQGPRRGPRDPAARAQRRCGVRHHPPPWSPGWRRPADRGQDGPSPCAALAAPSMTPSSAFPVLAVSAAARKPCRPRARSRRGADHPRPAAVGPPARRRPAGPRRPVLAVARAGAAPDAAAAAAGGDRRPGARRPALLAPRGPPAARGRAALMEVQAAPGGMAAAARAIADGEITSADLTERSIAAITEQDRRIGAFVVVLESALAEARERDAERARGVLRGPLHGVPVAVKDLIDVAGAVTTAGSPKLATNLARSDATVVARLRAAGAVILGKTRTHEFAYGVLTPGTSNPWDERRI